MSAKSIQNSQFATSRMCIPVRIAPFDSCLGVIRLQTFKCKENVTSVFN
jgi:hypothetical protein